MPQSLARIIVHLVFSTKRRKALLPLYLDPELQGQAKMGALLSGGVGLVAIALGRLLGLRLSKSR